MNRSHLVRGAAAAALAMSLALTACGTTAATPTETAGDALRIKYVVNGNLGDKSFIDSANAGLQELADEFGYQVQVVELGNERSKWTPGFEDAAAAGDYDIFVSGTFDMADTISKLAPDYPDKKFWFFDAVADYEGANGGCSNKCENVYSITFRQNEGGYLAGYISAGTLAAASLPGAESANKAGVIGATEIPIIQDFIVGFEAGFKAAGGSESNLIVQYIGGSSPFSDPARAKEIANSIYGQNAGIIWPVASGSGFGVFEASVDAQRYAIGVDSDQSETLEKPEQQGRIVTSILKNIGAALKDAAAREREGKVPYGSTATLGLTEDAVGYVDNAQFRALVPQAVREEVAEIAKQIADGTIDVPTALK